MARHIFQACPVWIYTQSNITQASYSPEYITPTQRSTCLAYLNKFNFIIIKNNNLLDSHGQKFKACFLKAHSHLRSGGSI